jgi:myo-inositol-1(or 4)-monophosphatase
MARGATPQPDVDPVALLVTMNRAADAAAAVIRDGARTIGTLDWIRKSHADFVSAVDRSAEAVIRDVLLRDYPRAHMMGEELTPDAATGAGLVFIVDPLDGTTNFLHGYPEYAVSIAAARSGELEAGVVLNVPTGERFTATRDAGATRGDQPIGVSRIADPGRALIGTGFPFKHPDMLPQWQAQFARIMLVSAGVRRAGSAALDLCDVACGRFDAFWELRLAPWDFAAGALIVREAGGVVTGLDGARVPLDHGPIVAGNPGMHAWLLEQLQIG